MALGCPPTLDVQDCSNHAKPSTGVITPEQRKTYAHHPSNFPEQRFKVVDERPKKEGSTVD